MMRSLMSLFGRSPFTRLQEHMHKVTECVDKLSFLFDAWTNGDRESVKKIGKEIMDLEHQADLIKDDIRDHLPRSVFLPVNRTDLLNLLHTQDAIADTAEDLAVILNLREIVILDDFVPLLKELIDRALDVCHQASRIVDSLDLLVETSFGGPHSKKIMEKIKHLGYLEWESDKRQYKLAQMIYSEDAQLGIASFVIWIEILKQLGALANASENVGNEIRLFLSK